MRDRIYDDVALEELESISGPCENYKIALESDTLALETLYEFENVKFALEFLEGDVRSGTAPDGTTWSSKMPSAYGYVPGIDGADGEAFDVYVAQSKFSPTSKNVFLISQCKLPSKEFDEHKAFLGFESEADVRQTFIDAFSDGKGEQRLASLQILTYPAFAHWLYSGAKPQEVSLEGLDTDLDNTDTETLVILPNNPQGMPSFLTHSSASGSLHILKITSDFDASKWGSSFDIILNAISTAPETDTVYIQLASPGGEVAAATRLVTAMRKSKARIKTIAIGPVASAACLVWCEGQDRAVTQGSYLMQHMGSHGEVGFSSDIADNAKSFVNYLDTVVFKRAKDIGLLSDLDVKNILTNKQNIFLSAAQVSQRTGAKIMEFLP